MVQLKSVTDSTAILRFELKDAKVHPSAICSLPASNDHCRNTSSSIKGHVERRNSCVIRLGLYHLHSRNKSTMSQAVRTLRLSF